VRISPLSCRLISEPLSGEHCTDLSL
jgi:hypothetical protein